MIIDDITKDLDWRESELGSLKVLLKQSGKSEKQKEVLLRAAWALLYAHYEGFAKLCLTLFYAEACRTVANCRSLPEKTRALALGSRLKEMRGMPSHVMMQAIERFEVDFLDAVPEFPDVETKSNLWPDVLEQLLEMADIKSSMVAKNAQKLHTLVARRNGIAHGEKNFIREVEYYLGFEEAVYEVMYDLALLIDERLKQAPYI